MKNNLSGFTLMEAIISVVIFSLVILSIYSIDGFARHHVILSQRQTVLQNEVSFIMEHMRKTFAGTNVSGGAIGGLANPPVVTVNNNEFNVRVDSNRNGEADANDNWVNYRINPLNGVVFFTANGVVDWLSTGHIMPNFENLGAATGNLVPSNNRSCISYRIVPPLNNYIDVQLTACWDPSQTSFPINTPDNPCVTLRSRINMPSVSTN
ncbi:MAG: prepilin-type N-terminal cleavage/methylation domain-containing protein [Candidatus Omnitrophica bacterium]|nr:prepilin-type N-terminal cleavage/methylation domain-containing protein [Candidatus Omnitrophota bacterium]